MSWCVYKHTSPSGKVYIGITSNVLVRWSGNGRRYTTYNSIFKKAIKKYGWQAIQHKVLQEDLSFEEATKLERELVAHYKAMNLSYNITDGGEGTLGRKVSEETRRKMRNNARGFCREAREAANTSPKRKEASLKNLEKAHTTWRGSKHSEHTIILMRKKALGRDMSKAVQAQAAKKSKKVLVISEEGNEAIFNSRAEAARFLHSNASNISRAIKRKVKVNNYKIYDYDNCRI